MLFSFWRWALVEITESERGKGKSGVKIRIFFHDKCFDGTASAALFSRFYRDRIRPDVDFQFSGLVHRAGALFNEQDFDGDENVIVDFKYSSSPKINTTCAARAPCGEPAICSGRSTAAARGMAGRIIMASVR